MDARLGKSQLLLPLAGLLCCALAIVLARSEEGQPQKKESQPEKKEEQPGKKDAQPEKKESQPQPQEQPSAPEKDVPGDVIAVVPPPFKKEGVFPCSGCHEDLELSPVPHKLTKRHKEIVLKHDEQNRWCLDCHTLNNMDKLHLASGKPIDFTESYKLCGQCHGPTLRDWKVGEHGKRTGSWSGKKEYLLCASCHDPHAPRFQPIKPLPPPVRPKDLR